jgi:hypothetical protein
MNSNALKNQNLMTLEQIRTEMFPGVTPTFLSRVLRHHNHPHEVVPIASGEPGLRLRYKRDGLAELLDREVLEKMEWLKETPCRGDKFQHPLGVFYVKK